MNRLVGYLRRAALGQDTMVTDEVTYFGMRYIVPVMVDSLGVILAVNVGGAVIPTLLSTYLLSKNRLWERGLIAIACVATICHAFARPVHGVSISLPIFVLPLVAAITAVMPDLTKRAASPLLERRSYFYPILDQIFDCRHAICLPTLQQSYRNEIETASPASRLTSQ